MPAKLQLLPILFFLYWWNIGLSQAYDAGSRRKGTSGNFVDCGKCWGHGVNPSADPRCKFGCSRLITLPPTKIPCETCVHAWEPKCEDGCDDGSLPPVDTHTWERVYFTPSPMLKRFPNIGSRFEPLRSNREPEKRSNESTSEKAKLSYSTNPGLGNSVWVIIGVAIFLAIVFTLVVSYVCKRSKISRSTFNEVEMRWHAIASAS